MKVTVIPIINDAVGTILQKLVKELEYSEIRGQIETIHTTTLRPARILSLRDLKRLTITLTPGRNYQLMPV